MDKDYGFHTVKQMKQQGPVVFEDLDEMEEDDEFVGNF